MSNSPQDVTEGAVRAAIRRRQTTIGISNTELADGAGIPLRTLNNYVHGGSKLYFGTLTSLAEALGTTVIELVQDAMELTRQGLVPEETEQPAVD